MKITVTSSVHEISTDQLGNRVVMGEGYFRMGRHCIVHICEGVTVQCALSFKVILHKPATLCKQKDDMLFTLSPLYPLNEVL
jgi:hypothetical protein